MYQALCVAATTRNRRRNARSQSRTSPSRATCPFGWSTRPASARPRAHALERTQPEPARRSAQEMEGRPRPAGMPIGRRLALRRLRAASATRSPTSLVSCARQGDRYDLLREQDVRIRRDPVAHRRSSFPATLQSDIGALGPRAEARERMLPRITGGRKSRANRSADVGRRSVEPWPAEPRRTCVPNAGGNLRFDAAPRSLMPPQ